MHVELQPSSPNCSIHKQNSSTAPIFSSSDAIMLLRELRVTLDGIEKSLCKRLDQFEARVQLSMGHSDATSTTMVGEPSLPNTMLAAPKIEPPPNATAVYVAEANSELEGEEKSAEASADPSFFGLRPDFLECVVPLRRGDSNKVERMMTHSHKRWDILDKFSTELDRGIPTERTVNRCIMPPDSRFRLMWDLVSMMLIVHDMAVVPLTLAFNPPESFLSRITRNLHRIDVLFWTVDMPLTFFTGIQQGDQIVQLFTPIAWAYLRGWFLLDVLIVGSSWLEVVVDFGNNNSFLLGRVGRGLRIIRICRTLRLLRLAKLRRIAVEIEDRITSEYWHIIAGMMKSTIMVLWMNHFLACGWWAIGSSQSHERSWTDAYVNEGVELQYVTALHWSMTQFTPASMEVFPANFYERVYAVLVLVFAMIVFSSFVSSITAAMTQLRKLQSVAHNQLSLLRRFLRMKQMPFDLKLRILRCADHRAKKLQDASATGELQLWKLLSQPLIMALLRETHGSVLKKHPFFSLYAEADPLAMQRVCTEAITEVELFTGDALFTEAHSESRMFFISSGKLRYHHCESTASHERSRYHKALLEPGTWCCEASLWTEWTHFGMMVAVRVSEVLAVDARTFSAITAAHQLVAGPASRYGAAFVAHLNWQSTFGTVSDIVHLDSELTDNLEAAFGQCKDGKLRPLLKPPPLTGFMRPPPSSSIPPPSSSIAPPPTIPASAPARSVTPVNKDVLPLPTKVQSSITPL